MEQGSPEKPLSSSLEQKKQPRKRQLEKRPRYKKLNKLSLSY